MKLEFSWQSFEKYSNINFMKIRPVGSELFHADRRKDGRTEMTKLIVAFHNFRKRLKIQRSHSLSSEGNQNSA